MTDDQSGIFSEGQYSAAVELQNRLEVEVNARHEATKDSVALVDVPPGSVWVEVDGFVGCKWPPPYDRSGVSCSYSDDGPCWHPEPEQRVRVLAKDLDAETCRWALRDTGLPHDEFTAITLRRCAHIMAGGSIESYVGAT